MCIRSSAVPANAIVIFTRYCTTPESFCTDINAIILQLQRIGSDNGYNPADGAVPVPGGNRPGRSDRFSFDEPDELYLFTAIIHPGHVIGKYDPGFCGADGDYLVNLEYLIGSRMVKSLSDPVLISKEIRLCIIQLAPCHLNQHDFVFRLEIAELSTQDVRNPYPVGLHFVNTQVLVGNAGNGNILCVARR